MNLFFACTICLCVYYMCVIIENLGGNSDRSSAHYPGSDERTSRTQTQCRCSQGRSNQESPNEALGQNNN